MNHQEFLDRLAGIFDGPKNAHLPTREKIALVNQLIEKMPEGKVPGGTVCEFSNANDIVFNSYQLKDQTLPHNLQDGFMDECEAHWNRRSLDMIAKLETGTALLWYCKDPASEGAREGQRVLAEGIAIAERLGQTLSDHRLTVISASPRDIEGMLEAIEPLTDKLVTLDIRADRTTDRTTGRVTLYGSRSDILAAMGSMIEMDLEGDVSISGVQPCEPRVPSYIDGESYVRRNKAREGSQQHLKYLVKPTHLK